MNKKITGHETRIFPVVSLTYRSPLIHVEVDSKNQPLLYQDSLDLKPAWINEYLQISIPLELHFTTPARWAQRPLTSQPILGLLHNLLEGLNGFIFFKPSRKWQLPRVISRWCLLEDSLVSQSSDSWCNALGCSHTPKNATSKQSEWERGSGWLKNVKKAFQSAKHARPWLGKEYI